MVAYYLANKASIAADPTDFLRDRRVSQYAEEDWVRLLKDETGLWRLLSYLEPSVQSEQGKESAIFAGVVSFVTGLKRLSLTGT